MGIDLLLTLITNKYILIVLAALGAITGVYLKGKSAGKDAIRADEQEAKDTLDSNIKKSEAKNQQIEKEKNNELQSIDAASDSESVTRLLNKKSDPSTDS